MGSFEVLALASAGIVLFAFLANEYGRLSSESIVYDSANFIGGLGLALYAYTSGAYIFILTNGVWALVAGIDVAKYLLKKRGLKRKRK